MINSDRWLSPLIEASTQTQAISYFAAYRFPKGMPDVGPALLKAYDGLALAHAVRTEEGVARLLTYWASRDHFVASGESFRARLEGQLLPGHGLVNKLFTKPPPWWRKVKLGTAVLSAAAFFGAMEIIDNRYDRVFAVPALVIKAEKSRIDINEGEPFRTTVTIVNQLPTTPHRNVSVSAYLLDKQEKRTELRLVESEIPVLATGAPRELVVEGAAPAVGDFQLVVSTAADAGRLALSKRFEGRSRLVVWSAIPVGRLQKVEARGAWARFGGQISVGRAAPEGLDCELQVLGVPGLNFENQLSAPVADRGKKWQTAGAGSDAIALLTWSLAPVASQQKVGIDLALLGDAKTDWDAVANNATLRCEYRKEKLDEVRS